MTSSVVKVEGNEEGKCKESGVEKSSSSLSSPKLGADPVVYKLVRVEGDGRLVPATDDELMEVGNLLADDKIEMHLVADTGQTGGSSSGMPQFESSEGLSQSENTEVDVGKSNMHVECIEEMLQEVKQDETHLLACGLPDHSSAYVIVEGQCSDQNDKMPGIDEKLQSEIPLQGNDASSSPSFRRSHINHSGSVGECSNPPNELIEGQSSASAVCISSKPDFSRLKGEICLDNLSIKELHETFRATFGRETTVKDKQWLKRRIAMGLTNSCDVSVSSFIIKDNKLVSKGKEESCNDEGITSMSDTVVGVVNVECKDASTSQCSQMEEHHTSSVERQRNSSADKYHRSEDLHADQVAAKRVRKPTRRYIEELSEVESKESSGKSIFSSKSFGLRQTFPKAHTRPVRIASSNRTVVMRLDSLGGSGVQIPYVSRVRRSRPRKDIMALMEFYPKSMGMTAALVKKTFSVHSSQPNDESGNIILEARSDFQKMQHPGQNMESKHVDPSGDTSDDNVVTVPTGKGGMRRKHHRAWTLSEVTKLVEGVSRYGAGRWSEIKRLAFASYSYRTSVDLKDKWRNLLKASLAQTPPDKMVNPRKHASGMPIPAPILLRVRELAKRQSQVPPNISSTSKLAGTTGRNNVHETRSSGYL
ncbi:uncharacterized protein LOC123212447 isoform X3 [Mangifera indica]|uniref:uncharacterized protein LOC123212447 isoform X3 n=1 Tax=Mangifera indica TaxID=29780 RepID=UPI001CFBCB42|nr:uncharacterized protein LOC123212447 isoform X3 [Mangifera indica]